MKAGSITPNGVRLEEHEYNTILFFTTLGKHIELIPPSNTPHSKTPDFFMDGLAWEAKCPKKLDRRTIERSFYAASNQSENIIMDLRRAKGKNNAVLVLEKCFQQTRKVQKMYIIIHNGKSTFYKK